MQSTTITPDIQKFRKNFMRTLEKDDKTKVQLDQIEDCFTKKPYFVEYKAVNELAKYSRYFFNIISILAGYYLVFSVVHKATGIEIVSYVLAGIFLVLIEVTKNFLLPKILLHWYAFEEIKPLSILFNLALVLLSGYISVKGIEHYSREVRAIDPTLVNVDSLAARYDRQIADVRQEKARFTESISYQGKINIYNPTSSKTLLNYDAQIQEIQTEKERMLTHTLRQNDQAQVQASHYTSTQTFYLMGLTGLNELLLVLCLWYGVYYMYRTNKQKDLIFGLCQSGYLQITRSDFNLIYEIIRSFGQTGQLDMLKTTIVPGPEKLKPKQSIGFQMGARLDQTDRSTELVDRSGQVTADDPLIRELLAKVSSLESRLAESSLSNLTENREKDDEITTEGHTHTHTREIISQPPKKERYDAETQMRKHLDIVEEIRRVLPQKPNISDIARKTGKHRNTVNKVYESMQILGQA
ncbi:MAG: hypothetical protein HC880_01210 [Bacteroidia bacterium]|nr:hypothetical protein [Bacteroidia bacterium]